MLNTYLFRYFYIISCVFAKNYSYRHVHSKPIIYEQFIFTAVHTCMYINPLITSSIMIDQSIKYRHIINAANRRV